MDEATKEVSEYMHEVKASPETESGFMTLGHRMDADGKEKYNAGKIEGREEERWELLMAMVNDGKISMEDAAGYLNITPEEFAIKIKNANEKVWKT